MEEKVHSDTKAAPPDEELPAYEKQASFSAHQQEKAPEVKAAASFASLPNEGESSTGKEKKRGMFSKMKDAALGGTKEEREAAKKRDQEVKSFLSLIGPYIIKLNSPPFFLSGLNLEGNRGWPTHHSTEVVRVITLDLLSLATQELLLISGLNTLRNFTSRTLMDLVPNIPRSSTSRILMDRGLTQATDTIMDISQALSNIKLRTPLHKALMAIHRDRMVLLPRTSFTLSSPAAVDQDQWQCPSWEVLQVAFFSVACCSRWTLFSL